MQTPVNRQKVRQNPSRNRRLDTRLIKPIMLRWAVIETKADVSQFNFKEFDVAIKLLKRERWTSDRLLRLRGTYVSPSSNGAQYIGLSLNERCDLELYKTKYVNSYNR